jgi:hypothetical protein
MIRYVITELMQSDLHKIIVSPQHLSTDHIKVFLYQILRGMLSFNMMLSNFQQLLKLFFVFPQDWNIYIPQGFSIVTLNLAISWSTAIVCSKYGFADFCIQTSYADVVLLLTNLVIRPLLADMWFRIGSRGRGGR